MLRRVDKLPKNVKPAKMFGSKFHVGHSETGHNHTTLATKTIMYDTDDILVSYLEVKESTQLVHERDFDTHEPLTLAPGLYEVRRQREFSPEGWRQVAD